uniref:Cleavage and polyadenylation specificity factor subunit 4 n=1 Tax=Biomphalaria glabrata TaxID=6526 RepID=A0A2C9LKE6_BIOGL
MQEIVAPVDGIKFDIELALELQKGAQPLPFPGMDSQCSNKECPFLHIDPQNKVRDCPWYDRGFCRHGPNCKNRHVRRVICQCYLNGFCLDGPNCKYVHPSFKIPDPDPIFAQKKQSIVCHLCMQPGHKAIQCHAAKQPGQTLDDLVQIQLQASQQMQQQTNQTTQRERRPLDQITCFKCGEKGHFANRCPKGHLAFLSAANYANNQSTGTGNPA